MKELYIDFYDLVDRPFELTPDPRYVYLSAHHKEALAHLKYGVEERKGFIQLTGEVGTGKTTMLDVLISELDASTAVAKLSHTTVNEVDLLRLIARGFGMETDADSKADLLDLLRERLSSWSKEGRNAVVVVDEAQNLDLPALEEIRLLSNLKVNGRLGLQIILAGQPELRDKLERSELRQLRQRIGIKYHLTPLSRQETADYIAHRMAVAGGEAEIFHPRAVEAIFEYSQGVPRIVNMVCDRALLAGYAENRRTIKADLVQAAKEALEGTPVVVSAQRGGARSDEPVEDEPSPRRRSRARWAVPLVSAVTVVALAVGAVFLFEEGSGPPAGDDADAVAAPVAEDSDSEARSSARERGGKDEMSVVSGVVGVSEGRTSAVGDGATEGVPEGESDVDVEDPGSHEAPVDEAAGTEAMAGAAVGERAGEGSGDAPGTGSPRAQDEMRSSTSPSPDDAVPEPARDALDAGGAEAWISRENDSGPERSETGIAGIDSPYLVVAASSRDAAAASRRAQEFRGVGTEAIIWTVDLGDRGVWHRIVLTPGYGSLEEAERALERLHSMGHEDAWVVRR
ncbi:MAG: AAA family ATPase [Candidatus Eisenbacteria bacterium]|nr:AAA family ATPase [Candidatus Eisenbacteria bacterium]